MRQRASIVGQAIVFLLGPTVPAIGIRNEGEEGKKCLSFGRNLHQAFIEQSVE